MRCPDCNKFVSYEEAEPEIESEEVSYDVEEKTVNVLVSVRRHLDCMECGTELKETTFEFDESFEVEGDYPKDTEFDLECEAENTERGEGKGRYTKTFYGVEVSAVVSFEGRRILTESFQDDCQASYFDELT